MTSGVTAVSGDSVTLSDGQQTRVIRHGQERAEQHIDLAYAITAHGAQGASETFAIALEGTLGMDELIAKAWRFVRERFRSYQTELKSRGIKRARARRDANRERQDIVTLVKRQLTREISEGRFTTNREAVKREVERRVKERMILSRNRNYSRLATASP